MRFAKGFASLLALAFTVCGCQQASSPSYYTPPGSNKTPTGYIQKKDDKFQEYISYESELSTEGNISDSTAWLLITKKQRISGNKLYYVQWGNFYSGEGWRFYYRASDSNATNLKFTQISRNVGTCGRYSGCTYSEIYNIFITDEMIANGEKSGISIKVFAKDSTAKIFTIPASLINAMIKKVKE